MINNPYIPIVNADNFDISLIYDAQEPLGETTILSLIKNLISDDISFQDCDYYNKESLDITDIPIIDSLFHNLEYIQLTDSATFINSVISTEYLNATEFHISDLQIFILPQLVNLNKTFNFDYNYILSKGVSDYLGFSVNVLQEQLMILAKTGLFADTSMLSNYVVNVESLLSNERIISDYNIADAKHIHVLKEFVIAELYLLSFCRLLQLADGEIIELGITADKDLKLKYNSLQESYYTLLKNNLFSEDLKINYLLYNDFLLNFIDITTLSKIYGISLSKTMDMAIAEKFSYSYLSHQNVECDYLSRLDYLYYLISNSRLEEAIDVVAIYLGLPSKCFTTTLTKMQLATILRKLTLDVEYKKNILRTDSKKMALSSTAKKIILDSEIENKCD